VTGFTGIRIDGGLAIPSFYIGHARRVILGPEEPETP